MCAATGQLICYYLATYQINLLILVFALKWEMEMKQITLMVYLPADGSFLAARMRIWTLEMIELPNSVGDQLRDSHDRIWRKASAIDRQLNRPRGRGGNISP